MCQHHNQYLQKSAKDFAGQVFPIAAHKEQRIQFPGERKKTTVFVAHILHM